MLKSIRTVKSLCAERDAKQKYRRWMIAAKESGFRMAPILAAFFPPAFFAIYANIALTFWLGVKLYVEGTVPGLSNVVIVLFSVQIIVGGFNSIVTSLQNIAKASAASAKCFEVIDAPKVSHEGLGDPDVNASVEIIFNDVHFTYPGRPEAEVLKGLSLIIPAGKITALVGPSGSGKSTIVALLERWYELSDVNEALPEPEKDDSKMTPLEKAKFQKEEKARQKALKKQKKASTQDPPQQPGEQTAILQNSGSIFVGTHNLESIHQRWWRTQIGLVQQEPFLFDDTIFDNVAHGLVGSLYESYGESERRALVEEACREAYAHSFISKLPQGYDTRVGESGVKLSGGQKQRLAIARSIVKKPQILVLDEATSSIDVKAEKIVQTALDHVSRGRTTITVAHRLSTIKKADKIIVLKDGAAMEHGTHNELLARTDGVYASLVRAQQLGLGDQDENDIREDAEKAGLELEAVLAEPEIDAAPDKLDEEATIGSSEDPQPKLRSFFKSVGVFLYEQRQHWVLFGAVILAAIGGGGVVAPQSYFTAQLITVFAKPKSEMLGVASFWALMFFVLALIVLAAYALMGFAVAMLSVHVATTYRQEYFETMLGKPITWFDGKDRSAGTLTSRLSYDPRQLTEVVGPNLALPMTGIFNIIGSIIIAFCFGWKMALVVVCAALPLILLGAALRVRYELQFESYNASVFEKSSQFAAESVGAFRTVTALTLETHIADRFQSLVDEHVRKAFRRARVAVLVFAFSESITLPCVALTMWYGSTLLESGEYDTLSFFVIYMAIIMGAQEAGQMLAFGTTVAQAIAGANRILDLRGVPEVNDEDADDRILPNSGAESEKASNTSNRGMAIEFQNVSFTYAERPVPVYRSLSFAVPAGGYVAFVGPSGCGKTTVISLLERFYSTDSGAILIDGVALDTLPLGAYRRSVALVSQEPTLFEGTVRENLCYGLLRDPSQEDVEEACRAAEIHDFIVSLDQGYGTPLKAGTHASLSGGQKQRVCIARALLRKPRLLLLDEATSSLDSQSEGLVKEAIDRVAARGTVTVLVVAHRLATVQNARKIVVLGEGGSILQEGTHGELRQKKGPYRDMCEGQALDR